MRFGQVIEYGVRNIFLQKSCRKLCKETSSKPFFKKFLYEIKASGFILLDFDTHLKQTV